MICSGNVGAFKEQFHSVNELHNSESISDIGKRFGVGIAEVGDRGVVCHCEEGEIGCQIKGSQCSTQKGGRKKIETGAGKIKQG
jgi:hypothetical protein